MRTSFQLMLVLGLAVLSVSAFAQQDQQVQQPMQDQQVQQSQPADLTQYLQYELNTIALLTAQSNYLLSQGDRLGASLFGSFVPDHNMQAQALMAAIRANGGDPSSIVACTPGLISGDRVALARGSLWPNTKAIDAYSTLLEGAPNDVTTRIATNGLNNITRQYNSMVIAQASPAGMNGTTQSVVQAALTLERATVTNLQTQAAQLQQLGDSASADMLTAQIAPHQQLATNLECLLTQMCGNPALAVAPAATAIPTRNMLMVNVAVMNTQMANTYAIMGQGLPMNSPILSASQCGQSVALAGVAQLRDIIAVAPTMSMAPAVASVPPMGSALPMVPQQ